MGSRSVAAILAEIKQCRTLETGKRLFTEAIAAGLYQSSSSATLLLGLYSRCGSIDDAVYIFDRLPCHSAVAWTCLIAGYTENGRPDLALELFSSSVRAPRSWEPSSRTIVAALSACSALLLASDRSKLAKMECRDRARWIHSRARENGLGDDVFVANALVDLYAKCGSLIESRGVFDRMRDRCVVSWTSLILGFAENGDGEFALELYSRVLLEGLAIDDRMLVAVYTACGSLAAIEDGRIKLRSLRRTMAIESLAGELGGDVFVGNALMDAYRKCGSLLDAARVFDTVEQRDVVSWTTRILGFVDAGEMELGLESFDAMKMECVPNSRAYVAALKACSGLGSLHKNNEQSRSRYLEKGRQIHVEVSSRGLEIDLYVATSLISMYASCGCVDRARSIFDAIAAKSSVCWNVMLAGYVENGDHVEALELLETMRIRPTARTFVAALEACAATTNSGAGTKLHGEICRAGMETDRCVATSLVDLYGKCGSVVKARQAFDSMSSTTIDTAAWSSLISGYGRLGDASNALDLVEAMEREGIEPDGAVILEVLTACSHAGLVDRGRGFFSRAKKSSYGHRIGIDHYNSVVDMLGRANRLEEAFAMARTMPVAANAMTWRALLAASRKWSNAEMGEEAFGLLMELGETEASSYVIMANIQIDRRGEGGELL